MKTYTWIRTAILTISVVGVSFTTGKPTDTLLGQWQQKFGGNVTVKSVYRTDGTFDIFINGKTFVSGKYNVSQDTLSISDPVCGVDYYGTYRLSFITPDSVRQTLIQDTCQVRRNSVSQSPALSRLKPTKP